MNKGRSNLKVLFGDVTQTFVVAYKLRSFESASKSINSRERDSARGEDLFESGKSG